MDQFLPRSFNVSGLTSGPVGHVDVRGQNLPMYLGVIARLNSQGFGILLDSEEHEHYFSFSAIPHYRGEGAATLATRGLFVGQTVNFAQAADKVEYVEPHMPGSRTSRSTSRRA